MKNKYYDLWLPYFKQGDDISHFFEQNKKKFSEPKEVSKQSFIEHAELLEHTANILRKVAEYTDQGLLLEDAMTHHIGVSCPEELGEVLVKENILYFFDDEYEEDADE